jgi:hypothetical protein
VSWTVTFSEPVTGVTASNFTLQDPDTTGYTVQSVTASSGGPSASTWTVTATASTTNSNGTLELDLKSNSGIKDLAGNALSTSSLNGAPLTIDTTAPTANSIELLGPSPTNATGVSWSVTFSKAVTGLTASNFTLQDPGGTGYTISTVSPSAGGSSGTTWTVTAISSASVSNPNGTLELDLKNNTGVKDLAGNALSTTSLSGASYTIDTTAPTASSVTAADPNPTSSTTLSWNATGCLFPTRWSVTATPSRRSEVRDLRRRCRPSPRANFSSIREVGSRCW